MRVGLSALAFVAAAGAAAAQENAGSGSSSDLAAMSGSALGTLRDAAQNRLYVGDVIGTSVTAPSGEKVGTVRNLVAVPGGKLVAVIIELSDGQRVAAPYQIMKVSAAAETADLSIPMGVEALTGSQPVKEMSSLLGL